MSIIWNTPAGSLGTVTERIILEIPISASSNVGPINFQLLSGKLPRGLRLDQNVTSDSSSYTIYIKGSPTEVKKITISRFVIRATDGTNIEDRTFSITVDGDDAPQWITKEGFLNVGPNNSYFVLDNSFVDFQLEVRDPDIIADDTLEFYLIPNGGELPPGLSLTRDGRIRGFTDPVFALVYNESRTGAYDTGTFDTIPLDIANTDEAGFDSYLYDLEEFDLGETAEAPRRLSRFYTFIIAASDGLHEIRRLFRIWVVTEDFLKSDNGLIQVDTNLFQADNDGTRKPIWITGSDLGQARANNYLTIFLDVYDPPSLEGNIYYFLLDTNPGTYRLKTTGEIITDGRFELSGVYPRFRYVQKGIWRPDIPYVVGDLVQWNGFEDSTGKYISYVCQKENIGQPPFEGSSEYWNTDIAEFAETFRTTDSSQWEVIVAESLSIIPPGMSIDNITGEIAGRVPYQSAISETYKFTVNAINFPPVLFEQNYVIKGTWSSSVSYVVGDAVRYDDFVWVALQESQGKIPEDGEFWDRGVDTQERTFSIKILGEVETAISWISDSDLGDIKPNLPCEFSVQAISNVTGGTLIYEVTSGKLPPGLNFIANGQIQGKVKQFADSTSDGLTRFFERLDDEGLNSSTEDSSLMNRDFTATFDSDTTTFDRIFEFEVKAKDFLNSAENIRVFKIIVNTEDETTYANLYAKAFQSKDKRLIWYNFITDSNIFREPEIYRYGDANFGIQTDLKMLIYAGIESKEAQNFVQALSRNHYRKQVRFGEIRSAQARDPITQNVIYEVIYVDIVDELEKNGKSISSVVQLPDYINSPVLISYDAIKVDSDIPLVSDRDHQRIFPNSFKNMRSRIKTVGQRNREFLPLWMRTIQSNNFVESGYVKALILCYLKPGYSASVITRIKNIGFDFKQLDFTIDRFLIDVIDGEFQTKYLAFPQRGEKLP